jgi:hypothetical protein
MMPRTYTNADEWIWNAYLDPNIEFSQRTIRVMHRDFSSIELLPDPPARWHTHNWDGNAQFSSGD